jgi:hypothetical protein
MGIKRLGFDEKYLGLPVPASRLKGDRFQSWKKGM